jgi:hypothetical protein
MRLFSIEEMGLQFLDSLIWIVLGINMDVGQPLDMFSNLTIHAQCGVVEDYL